MTLLDVNGTLSYTLATGLDAQQGLDHDHVLGVAGFGGPAHPPRTGSYPLVWINMPVLEAGPRYEIWTSRNPVERISAGMSGTFDGEVLFGCLQLPQAQGESLDTATLHAYSRLFEFIDAQAYPHLLRVWNYFPAITRDECGMERYQRFCMGRHQAFAQHGRRVSEDAPAACALGTQGREMTVYFLAGKQAGMPIENPRQVSAYHYPPQYGPNSPSFARATFSQWGAARHLYISGTAAIVGHESLHPGDVALQLSETIENMRAVTLEALRRTQVNFMDAHKFLKVYLRRAEDWPAVRPRLLSEFGAQTGIACLQADICRKELLLEIEAAYLK